MRIAYPFSAIVGQDDMKLAVLIAAVEPGIGGVLAFGDRGTGKSTAVRGLAALLPPLKAIAACRYGCDPDAPDTLCSDCRAMSKAARAKTHLRPVPVVDLPLGASEDRVLGALDIEAALTRGVKAFEPGLFAKANRGFLYIDEVNLLDDHLVDVLLDVAASGENLVEREGLSVRHPARFVLIGTGNPEEGELRPQLLDRFGLFVEVTTPTDIAERVEVVRRREAFERDPSAFLDRWRGADARLRQKVLAARRKASAVEVPDVARDWASRLCVRLGTDGLRGELTLLRAARAYAALEGETVVSVPMLARLAPMTLRHRLRRDPMDDAGSGVRIERALAEITSETLSETLRGTTGNATIGARA